MTETEYEFEWEIDFDGDICITDPSQNRIQSGYTCCLTPEDVEKMMKGLGIPTTAATIVSGGRRKFGTTDDD